VHGLAAVADAGEFEVGAGEFGELLSCCVRQSWGCC
jgi:hypothetical protein